MFVDGKFTPAIAFLHDRCLMSVVKDSFPTRPVKQFAQM